MEQKHNENKPTGESCENESFYRAAQLYETELKKRLHILQSVDIGAEVESVMKSQGRTAVWLADRLKMNRSNLYNIFHRKSIDVVLLMRISFVLNYDFLRDCSNLLNIENDRTEVK